MVADKVRPRYQKQQGWQPGAQVHHVQEETTVQLGPNAELPTHQVEAHDTIDAAVVEVEELPLP